MPEGLLDNDSCVRGHSCVGKPLDGDPEEDGELHYFEYELPSSADDYFFLRVRFMLHAGSSSDYMYVDDVKLEGTAM